MNRKSVLVLGGGLAGIAAAVALAESNMEVSLVERHRFLGGRAAAFPVDEGWLDNCQHVILGCCTNLLHLLEKLGTRNKITFHREIPFLANGKTSSLIPTKWPVPFHFLPSFLNARLFSPREKVAVIRLFARLLTSAKHQESLNQITMLHWLKTQKQSDYLIENFWSLILISSVNETLERMSAKVGVMVLQKAFLGNREAALIGTPDVSLAELYHEPAQIFFRKNGIRFIQGKIQNISFENEKPEIFLEDGISLQANEIISTLPFYNLLPILPKNAQQMPFFNRFNNFETSPIIGIHLWFDRTVSDYPFGAFVGSPIHWFFVKPSEKNGAYLQLVISASYSLMTTSNDAILALALKELNRFLPGSRNAALTKARVVREARATFSATPGSDALRPPAQTPIPHFYLAGDWTDTGWPATMEGAVQSGYRAAELLLQGKL